jgi:antirestriction protein ArdC
MAIWAGAHERYERVRQARAVLNEHVNVLAEQMRQGKTEALMQYLEFTARFHRYSFCNVLLIHTQRPDATQVAGLRHWNRLGRHVRFGERGLMIFAPMRVKKRRGLEQAAGSDDEEVIATTLFKVVYVFDVAQTDGAALPELIQASGDPGPLYPALQSIVRRGGIKLDEVQYVPGSPNAEGASYGGRIALRLDLGPAEAFRTLVHEFAHEKLHWQGEKESKTIRETEADATAFVVCRHFGIHSDSADYLLLYDATPDVLLSRLETVRDTAAEIIADLEVEIGAAVPTEESIE